LSVGVGWLSGVNKAGAGAIELIKQASVQTARQVGAQTIRFVATHPNEAMARLLRMQGFTQVMKDGILIDEWVQVVSVK
jgi:hypothetical protein